MSGAPQNSNKFCDFIFKCNLSQFVDSPTHIRANTPDLIHNISVDPDSNRVISFDYFVISFYIVYFWRKLNKNKPVFVHDCPEGYQ